jgi:Ca2+-binding RTX toxin-like protein
MKSLRVVAMTLLLANGLAMGTATASVKIHYCFGEPATIVGTANADTIYGTPGDDVIYAGRGADVILGEPVDDNDEPIGEGNDRICGGPGNDRLLTGFKGDDRVRGGHGDDIVGGRTEFGSDVLRGGRGDDFVREAIYDSGDNLLRGGFGNDTLVGGDHSSSVMYGGGGDDTLRALAPWVADHLNAGSGADTVDSRDWVQEEGVPPDTFTPDVVDGGTNLSETADNCLMDAEDAYVGCESVQFGF